MPLGMYNTVVMPTAVYLRYKFQPTYYVPSYTLRRYRTLPIAILFTSSEDTIKNDTTQPQLLQDSYTMVYHG
jgi:hypothetical protein